MLIASIALMTDVGGEPHQHMKFSIVTSDTDQIKMIELDLQIILDGKAQVVVDEINELVT